MPAPSIDFSRFTLRGDLPAHRQVAAYLKVLIALGHLNRGSALPGAPALATRLKVPASEVRHAYAELSERGFVAQQNGRWRVSDEPVVAGTSTASGEIRERMGDLILEARKTGVSRAELKRMFATLIGRA